MSTTLSTQFMVSELQVRMPMSLNASYCLDRLNLAYRWIEQHGSFVWNLRSASLSLLQNTLSVAAPADFNPGKQARLYNNTVPSEVIYLPFDEWARQRTLLPNSAPGLFSNWTFVTPNILVCPDSAIVPLAATSFTIYYHRMTPAPLANGPAIYFPTPDEFDDLIVDLAESEIRRLHSLSGWELVRTKAQEEILRIADQYRSTKLDMGGAVDAGKKNEEAKIRREKITVA